AGAEASDTLKYFSERIPATFVYAGISLDRTGLLSGTRGEQIAGRFSMVRADRRRGGQPATAPARAGHSHQPGPLPAPAHSRDDRKPALADPQRGRQRGPRRNREDHQE